MSSLSSRFEHNKLKGETGTIEVQLGTSQVPTISKGKSGNLLVVNYY